MQGLLLVVLFAFATSMTLFSQPNPNTIGAGVTKVRAGAIPLDGRSPSEGASTDQWFGETPLTLSVRNVTRPTVTPFLPAQGKATGAAALVVPGGWFYFESMGNEGVPVAEWLSEHGIAAFLVKYRTVSTPHDEARFKAAFASTVTELSKSGLRSELRGERPAREDVQQALRLVRTRAAEWGIDPQRIGLVGFSAGAITTLNVTLANAEGAQPAFAGIIYGRMLPVTPPPAAPPIFVALAADDPLLKDQGFGLVESWRKAGRTAELHSYQRGGHGFGMKQQGSPSDHWIDDFYWWLQSNGFLK